MSLTGNFSMPKISTKNMENNFTEHETDITSRMDKLGDETITSAKGEVAGATTSPVALKELIQAQLAERLLDNMKLPALRNRTGRFRRSAQVQNVMVGPRGGTEVQYTYMKDPYSTFEPGGNMGSTDRDPRRLIDKSIREAAAHLALGRFYTRRL